MMPTPVRLFHITAIDNLAAICQQGALVSKNALCAKGLAYQNIAHLGAQTTRSVKPVPNPPGGSVHDYVPFYFAPRSPMLSALHNGNVAGCLYKQDDILHFETTVERATASNSAFVFYDRNATKPYSLAFTDLAELARQVAWDLLTEAPRLDGFCKYFFDNPTAEKYLGRMERRQAEFLLKHRVHLSVMTRIGVANKVKADVVRNILAETGVALSVEVKTDWYF
jgi:hypothetical protein